MCGDMKNSQLLQDIDNVKCNYEGFSSLPRNVVLDFKLSLSDIKVYIYLVDRIGYGCRKHLPYVEISNNAGVSLRQAKISVKSLFDREYIDKIRTIRNNGYHVKRFNGGSLPFSDKFISKKLTDIDIYMLRYLFLSFGNNGLPSNKHCKDVYHLTRDKKYTIEEKTLLHFEGFVDDFEIWEYLNE